MRFIPKQRCQCAKCDRPIVERKRKPCPDCGSLNRVIARTADDAVGANDKL
jgi:Zn finger protein HypA/HybF involved in hydrogenase expression